MGTVTQIDHQETPCWCSEEGKNNKHPGGEKHHPGCDTFQEENPTHYEETIILESETFEKLGRILELAQGHSDEEISYSDVVRVLLNLAHGWRTNTELGTLVYRETV